MKAAKSHKDIWRHVVNHYKTAYGQRRRNSSVIIRSDNEMPAKPEEKPVLRLVTYMCPSHPVELFETLMAYLEEEVKVEAVLQYESRHPGPLPDRKDPFEHNLVDLEQNNTFNKLKQAENFRLRVYHVDPIPVSIDKGQVLIPTGGSIRNNIDGGFTAFMTPAEYLRILDSKNQHAELLPVAAVFKHPKNTSESPEYFSDIIVHSDTRNYVNELLDLRGCQWAYNYENSLSGYVIVLKALQENGEGSQFFGNTLKANTHLGCIQMVQQKQAEAAAVDANVLAHNQKNMPDYGKDISVLTSLGPLPPYPIVINKKVPEPLKKAIVEALLKATKTRLWGKRLEKFGIVDFQANSMEKYFIIRETYDVVKNKRLNNTYY